MGSRKEELSKGHARSNFLPFISMLPGPVDPKVNEAILK